MTRLVLLVPFFATALWAGGQTCPWMNAASAAGYLETAVHAAVTGSGNSGTCEFSGRRGSASLDLRIEVAEVAGSRTPVCGARADVLKGIGNEASVCDHQGKSGGVSEQVVGRVRDQAFLVRLSSSGASAHRDELRAAVARAAEQVAGNLF